MTTNRRSIPEGTGEEIMPESWTAAGARMREAIPAQADDEQIRAAVRAEYGAGAAAILKGEQDGCGSGCCGGANDLAATLYPTDTLTALPDTAVLAARGCGNPTALAELRPGEVVLDLGSGGGIDVLLSARRVGPTGTAYGLDMTDEMLALAEENKRKAGVTNVEFLKGNIEAIPLPDNSVDVIISNCVINLSTDKDAVIREAYRVLRPGGRFAVSDIVVQGESLPENVQRYVALWTGCIAGALTEQQFLAKLASAGFVDGGVEVTTVYTACDIPAELREGLPPDLGLPEGTRIVSAFVRATKPRA